MSAEAELRAEVARLKATLADASATLPTQWKLTATEERIFRVLLACEIATRAAISEGAGVKVHRTQNVHLSRIRPKLKNFGIEIETVQRRGWRLVGRDAWRALLNKPQAA